jgi:hypothetical protein
VHISKRNECYAISTDEDSSEGYPKLLYGSFRLLQ